MLRGGESQYNVYGTYQMALLPPAKTEVTAEASALYDCHAVKLVDDMDVQCKKCDIIGPLHVHGPQETTQSFSVFASPDSHENATEAYWPRPGHIQFLWYLTYGNGCFLNDSLNTVYSIIINFMERVCLTGINDSSTERFILFGR